MLGVLHLVLWGNAFGPLAQSLMLAHLGLFLIWQPLWDNELRLKLSSGLIFVLTALVLVIWLDWWVMTVWLLLLIGIVGGRLTLGRRQRFAYLAALMFLFAELLMRAIPVLFNVEQAIHQSFDWLGYGLMALPIALYVVPTGNRSTTTARVDLLYGLLISLLAGILASGGLINTFHTGTPYIGALFQTIVGIAIFLLLISLLSSPRSGFSGLTQLWESHLLNIGTPFEQWLKKVSDAAESKATPPQFLHSAMGQLAALPWVSGATWTVGGESWTVGERTLHNFEVQVGELECTVYANLEAGSSLLLHGKLLIHLIGHFYEAKRRELLLTNNAHLRAIYETGARVTHDIKNLLQSLHTMTVAVARGGSDPGAIELMARQLPNLTQRLQMALDKLQAPSRNDVTESSLASWWTGLQQRKDRAGITFVEDIQCDVQVPVELLDSAVENLLENARIKRQIEPNLNVEVTLLSTPDVVSLEVSDDGTALPAEIERHLFKGPVKSQNGLGIGLYQAARQADQCGYQLSLKESRPGRVCFQLVRDKDLRAAPHPLRRKGDLVGPYERVIGRQPRLLR